MKQLKPLRISGMEVLQSVRRQVTTPKGGPQTTPKGLRGYDRKRAKRELQKGEI